MNQEFTKEFLQLLDMGNRTNFADSSRVLSNAKLTHPLTSGIHDSEDACLKKKKKKKKNLFAVNNDNNACSCSTQLIYGGLPERQLPIRCWPP